MWTSLYEIYDILACGWYTLLVLEFAFFATVEKMWNYCPADKNPREIKFLIGHLNNRKNDLKCKNTTYTRYVSANTQILLSGLTGNSVYFLPSVAKCCR